jgi:hypothetical protein
VETLRSIAELMIWGDQHNPSFFDFFLEKQVLAQFLKLVSHRNSRRGGVGVQILQTLSIMIQVCTLPRHALALRTTCHRGSTCQSGGAATWRCG